MPKPPLTEQEMAAQARSLAEWLEMLPNVLAATPVSIAIEGSTYIAARYRVRVIAPAGSRAALEHRAPTLEDRFYVLGERPASHRRGHVAYVLAGDPCDWFVAGWAELATVHDPRFAEFHPRGVWFGLHRWTAPEAIDAYERTPYRRIPITVTDLPATEDR